MTPAIIGFWLLVAGAALPAQSPPPDLHLVVESQFNYLARTRTTTIDTWISAGKRATKIGDVLTIAREDLGVRWRIDLKAGTYTETKIQPPAPAPPPEKEDIHTLGYGYLEPEFEWAAAAAGEKTTLLGRPCTQYASQGDADYGESSVKFWVCEPIAGVKHPVNELVLGLMRNESSQKFLQQTAAKQGNGWVLAAEEIQEPPVATTMTTTVNVRTLDAGNAPAGTFDLPANIKKAAR